MTPWNGMVSVLPVLMSVHPNRATVWELKVKPYAQSVLYA